MLPASDTHKALHNKKQKNWKKQFPHLVVGIALFHAVDLVYHRLDILQNIDPNDPSDRLLAKVMAGGIPLVLGFMPGYYLSKKIWPVFSLIGNNFLRKCAVMLYIIFFLCFGVYCITAVKEMRQSSLKIERQYS